eukprot:3933790-Rhodomonas_salina.1
MQVPGRVHSEIARAVSGVRRMIADTAQRVRRRVGDLVDKEELERACKTQDVRRMIAHAEQGVRRRVADTAAGVRRSVAFAAQGVRRRAGDLADEEGLGGGEEQLQTHRTAHPSPRSVQHTPVQTYPCLSTNRHTGLVPHTRAQYNRPKPQYRPTHASVQTCPVQTTFVPGRVGG